MSRQHRKPLLAEVVLCCGLCAVGLALATMPVLQLPGFVRSVSIDNPTDNELRVDVADRTQAGWIDLGTLGARSTLTVQEVLDQGRCWVFRLRRSADGRGYALLQFSRSELVAAHWSITVPNRVVDLPRSPELDRIDAEETP